MRVVGTFHPSSSVTHSLKCSLTPDSTLEHLVVAKTDRLEVYSLQPDGLKLECSADMWGRIVGVRAVPARVSRSRIVHLQKCSRFSGWRRVETASYDRSS